MPSKVAYRGATISFGFEFTDGDGNAVSPDSATLQLTYPGHSEWQTELLTLTDSDGVWGVTWDSTKTRPAWVDYHAHAIDGTISYVIDGRFKVEGNAAGLQHDKLPASEPSQYDYGAE